MQRQDIQLNYLRASRRAQKLSMLSFACAIAEILRVIIWHIIADLLFSLPLMRHHRILISLIAAIPFPTLAIVFGVAGLRLNRGVPKASGRRWAIAGVALGLVLTLPWIVIFAFGVFGHDWIFRE